MGTSLLDPGDAAQLVSIQQAEIPIFKILFYNASLRSHIMLPIFYLAALLIDHNSSSFSNLQHTSPYHGGGRARFYGERLLCSVVL
jgi:hypothetical protein